MADMTKREKLLLISAKMRNNQNPVIMAADIYLVRNFLAELREPDDRMLGAGSRLSGGNARQTWQAMINAIGDE